jgi:outer membrane protein OmpA-like peptidoglycan-associated protein
VSRTAWRSMLAAGVTASTLAACATSVGEPALQAPRRHAAIGQVVLDTVTRFVTCEGCAKPTPKTLASAPMGVTSINAASSQPTHEALAHPAVSVPAITTAPPAAANTTQRAQISFGFASAALSSEARQQLAGLLPQLRKATSVAIVGYTDDQGGQQVNDSLAEARAVNVMLYLRDALGDASKTVLSANGKGRCCYLDSSASDRARAANRRVELLIRTEYTPSEADAGANRNGSSGGAAASVRRRPS